MNQALSILLVEDDATLKEMYQIRLEQEGFKVVEVDTGEEALSAIAQNKFDLVLLDIMLPGISGLDVLSKLRTEEATKDLPIIILSALATDEDKMRGQEHGATAYIAKSEATPKEVIDKIKDTLNAS